MKSINSKNLADLQDSDEKNINEHQDYTNKLKQLSKDRSDYEVHILGLLDDINS